MKTTRLIDGVVSPAYDLVHGVASYRIWGAFAVHDLKQRYRRSKIGPFWYVLNNFIFIAALGAVYAQIFKQDVSYYLPYLSGGFIVWQFISASLTEGANCIVENGNVIKQVNVPLSVHPIRTATRNMAILLHNTPLMLAIPIYWDVDLGWELLLLPFSFIILYINSIWIGIVLGLTGARYRDVQPIMQNVVTISFFLTPIMWMQGMIEGRDGFVDFNPLFHFISIVRDPLMGILPSYNSFLIVIAITIVGVFCSWLSLKYYRDSAAYWL